VSRAYLGITGLTIDDSLERLNLATDSGVLVQEVQPRSPAASAGIKGGDTQATIDGTRISLGGDVITGIDGRKVTSMDDVVEAVNERKPGQSVKLELRRDGKSETVTVKLGQRPERAPSQ
jgi:serine protease Do